MFVEFETPEQAVNAVRFGNGRAFDKSHTLWVNKFDDVEGVTNMDDEYKDPEIVTLKEKEHLRSWLMDYRARDQFFMMKQDEVSILWNNKTEPPEVVHARQVCNILQDVASGMVYARHVVIPIVHNKQNWTDYYVQWSPKGTYLATFHKQGVQLWGGSNWDRISKYAHPNVKLLDFSPNESYMVTWSSEPFMTPEGESHVCRAFFSLADVIDECRIRRLL